MGDDAIRTLGRLLPEATAEQNTLADKIEYFNRTSEKPYKLSLAMGYTICDTEDLDSDAFLHQMDMKMYRALKFKISLSHLLPVELRKLQAFLFHDVSNTKYQ